MNLCPTAPCAHKSRRANCKIGSNRTINYAHAFKASTLEWSTLNFKFQILNLNFSKYQEIKPEVRYPEYESSKKTKELLSFCTTLLIQVVQTWNSRVWTDWWKKPVKGDRSGGYVERLITIGPQVENLQPASCSLTSWPSLIRQEKRVIITFLFAIRGESASDQRVSSGTHDKPAVRPVVS